MTMRCFSWSDWMLKGDDGKPRVNWRWYWAPNPNCYELDATHPDAFESIADSFRQLTAWGVSYYKIDFIAAEGILKHCGRFLLMVY